ncbi:MAG: GAF domain-containing protein [Chthonomonadales bacterium]
MIQETKDLKGRPSPGSNLMMFRDPGLSEAIPVAAVAWDVEGIIVEWNPAAERVFGWTAAEVIGEPLLDRLVPPGLHHYVDGLMEELRSGASAPVTSTNENFTADGRTILCQWSSGAVRNKDGSIKLIVSMALDVTTEVRQRQREERLSEIIQAANASREMDEILKLIRQAILDMGEIDRVAAWTVGCGVLWGHGYTDSQGKTVDERHLSAPRNYWSETAIAIIDGAEPYALLTKPLIADSDDGSGMWRSDENAAVVIGIPLRVRGETSGLILIDNRNSGRSLIESEITTLLNFCGQVAHAVSNVQLLDERSLIVQRQRGLMEIVAAISSTVDLDEVLKLIREAVSKESGFDRAGVWLLEEDQLRGTWGTDPHGQPCDERHITMLLSAWGPNLPELLDGRVPYYLETYVGADLAADLAPRLIPHAVIALRIAGQVVGIISLDNQITFREFDPNDLNLLVPFANQAAVAIRNAQVTKVHTLLLERERRLMELSTAISASLDLDRVLRMVRDAAVDVGGFEKVGVWLLENDRLLGSWGTDSEGNIRDERSWNYRIEDGPHVQELVGTRVPFIIQTLPVLDNQESEKPTYIRQAIIALRAGDELVGILTVSNTRVSRTLTPDLISTLLPFAGQAAVAIRNARLVMDRERIRLRSEQLMQIASGMNASYSLEAILKMVRDSLVGPEGFDRAAVFLYDPATNSVSGTWGSEDTNGSEDFFEQITSLSPSDDWPLTRVIRGEIDFALTDDLTEAYKLPPGHTLYGVRDHAIVPLRTSGEVVGAICVDNVNSGRPITMHEIEYLLPFAEQTALAIQNSRLFRSLKQAQDALVGTEKLRALGELASGVAHNINNLLTAVLGYAEMIQVDSGNPDRVLKYAKVIERAGLDGAEIVRRIQQFARKEPSLLEARVDLSLLGREAVDLARPVLVGRSTSPSDGIELVLDLTYGAWVTGVATELREVILNLVLNAVDAMPTGGKLTVHSEMDEVDARLEVCDTGVGMSESVRRRIFDPFFTTKGPSLGTGLGLSLAWGVIGRHGGAIDVKSSPGNGSCFTIRLERAEPGGVTEL